MHRSSKIYKDTANIVANPREVEANLLYRFASRLRASVTHASVRALFVGVIHQASRIWKAWTNVG